MHDNPGCADAFDELTGRLAGTPRPSSITEEGGGGKFLPDGTVLPFAGNTFVCHVNPDSRSHEEIVRLQQELQRSPFADHYTFLPTPSFHMTLLEGINATRRVTDGWPEGVSHEASRDEVSTIIRERIANVTVVRPPRIRPAGIQSGKGLSVVGADKQAAADIVALREKLSAATGIRRSGFSSYILHITLAYQTHWFDDSSAREVVARDQKLGEAFAARVPVIELQAPEFCNFESMYHFEPLVRIGPNGPEEICRQEDA